MLAGLLLNEPVGGFKVKRKCPRNGILNGRFVMMAGVQFDTESAPEPQIIKALVKEVKKLKLPKQVRTRALAFASRIDTDDKLGLCRAGADHTAYKGLLELVKKHISEEEEMALVMILLGVA
ncbi:MAG: hypothetical protein KAS66_05255 [Candidatus Omnitrophica bacterium]|nr:hypothetical protein [Candidatus Omnitrophota bacterium]